MTALPPDPDANQPLTLTELFEQSVRQWPDAVAVDVPPGIGRPERTTLTYAELGRQSELLARTVHLAVGRDNVAAILLSRNTEQLYAAQLAVLRSASAYVCIDPAFPDDQVDHILRDSAAATLLTDAKGAARARRIGYEGSIIRVDAPRVNGIGRLPAPPTPDTVAYIIYTSGSTGRPKGVRLAHRGIRNLMSAEAAEFGIRPGDRVAQNSSSAYDQSIEETWLALVGGGTVVVMDDDTVRLGPDLVGWLRDERITVFVAPPTLLRTTGCDDPHVQLPDLRVLFVGGEALAQDVADKWARGRRMVNGYGPTECTVTCMWQDIVPGREVSIGYPVPGMSAWVLDENLASVPAGERGELCMGGIGLAVGYLNRPELNASKFPQHPELGRIYRTGDLVHVESDGTFFYHGRIDSQVKLRGYRIELEAIESSLTRCAGVREAACRVQGTGATEILAAHVVPSDPEQPPAVADLQRELVRSLPKYMMPSAFGLTNELPRNASGKVNRRVLPLLAVRRAAPAKAAPPPRDPVAKSIAEAVREVLELPGLPSVDDDFFTDLGGSSLSAAMLITTLRTRPATASIAVRDVYDARTVAALARLTEQAAVEPHVAEAEVAEPAPAGGNAIGATVAQSAWLLLEALVAAPLAYLVTFVLLPWLSDGVGLGLVVLLAPVILAVGSVAYLPLSVAIAACAKRILIGEFRAGRIPVWSGFHVRMWIVKQFVRLIPWARIAGTEFQCTALRALGARIGERVHIHRGVDLLQGGWDLLDIGDDVTISQDARLALVHLEDEHVVLGPVTLAAGATLDVRAGVGPHTRIGADAWLSALSFLSAGGVIPDGERWDGVPACAAGMAAQPPRPTRTGRQLSPKAHGRAMILSDALLRLVMSLPYSLIFMVVIGQLNLSYGAILSDVEQPAANLPLLAGTGVALCLAQVGTVLLEAVAARVLGTVSSGVISRWSLAYIRVWLKSGLVAASGRWLSGSMFWPMWLRVAGMEVGRGCEIGTIFDVVPELVHLDQGTFFADGVYLGGPRIHRGTVALETVHLARNTFLGNHAMVGAGEQLPPDILIGIATVADDRIVRPGTAWFGHPPFELPNREIVDVDRTLTHNPSPFRVAHRAFWELLRFALPVLPALGMGIWVLGINDASAMMPTDEVPWFGALLAGAASVGFLCLVVLVLKWLLLGKVREGTHPLWSGWCFRWDFHYVAWDVVASSALASFEGTLLLPIYLRGMGMKIGKRVVLGDGFAHVVDPDMLHIDDRATVNAMFQAHTFEDRVLKIGHIHVGARSTLGAATIPLYGADIGEGAFVAPHSVVMKHEHLRPGLRYTGVPVRRERAAIGSGQQTGG